MKEWKLEVLTSEQVKKLSADLSKDNDDITETAGFIPLEVKFKQFEQNGIINQLRSQDFTSSDYRDMYLHEDFDITPEDDFEDVEEKLQKLQEFRSKLEKDIKARNLKKVSEQKNAESKESDSADENKE